MRYSGTTALEMMSFINKCTSYLLPLPVTMDGFDSSTTQLDDKFEVNCLNCEHGNKFGGGGARCNRQLRILYRSHSDVEETLLVHPRVLSCDVLGAFNRSCQVHELLLQVTQRLILC